MPDKARTPFDRLPASQQAGILCNDPQFQRFAAIRCGLPGEQFSPTAAAEYLRNACQIITRRDLNMRGKGFDRFNQLRTDFDAWRGRIAAPCEGFNHG